MSNKDLCVGMQCTCKSFKDDIILRGVRWDTVKGKSAI